MSFLPAECLASLNDLGHRVDEKMSRLKQSTGAGTRRFRQACYIGWCNQNNVPDPCGKEEGYERIIAYFVEQLILDHNPRSGTVRGYIDAINSLFDARMLPLRADFEDRDNMSIQIFKAWEKEEGIANKGGEVGPRVL